MAIISNSEIKLESNNVAGNKIDTKTDLTRCRPNGT